VLTGMEDDGTAGLIAIKRCGGVTVVQDPRDAAYSGMPMSALDNANVDYCVSISDIGPLLTTLVSQAHGKSKAVPEPRWTAQNRPSIDNSKPATTGVAAETNGVLLRGRLGAQVRLPWCASSEVRS